MALSLERLLQNIRQLQIALDHPDCRNRLYYHDLYLTSTSVLLRKGEASDYWPAIAWYDTYFLRQAHVRDDDIGPLGYNPWPGQRLLEQPSPGEEPNQ